MLSVEKTPGRISLGGVPGCSSFVGTSFTVNCLQSVNSSDVLAGLLQALAETTEQFPFDPTLDGPHGLFPGLPSELFPRGQFARLPFIAGTNLDEGSIVLVIVPLKS